MSDAWTEISCDIPVEFCDVVAGYLSDISGSGVCIENLDVDAFSLNEITHAEVMNIRAYFRSGSDISIMLEEISRFLKNLAIQNPPVIFPSPRISTVRDQDWSNNWKSHFKALRVGRRILIVPSWEEPVPQQGDIVLRLDPGMAFGTGGHETTRLCLELLEQVMDQADGKRKLSLLDLGTGSGILAMAAARLGASPVKALDIDPQAVEIARENFTINSLEENICVSTASLDSCEETFDIILANILAEDLVRIASSLAERLSDSGTLILSGILNEKESFVRAGFLRFPLLYQETQRDGEWVAMLYKRVSSS